MLHYAIYYREDEYTGYSGSYEAHEEFESHNEMTQHIKSLKQAGCYDIQAVFLYDDTDLEPDDDLDIDHDDYSDLIVL